MSEFKKPRCDMPSDGNVFAVIGYVKTVLSNAGHKDKAKEFREKALSAGSYDEALALCTEYVEFGEDDSYLDPEEDNDDYEDE